MTEMDVLTGPAKTSRFNSIILSLLREWRTPNLVSIGLLFLAAPTEGMSLALLIPLIALLGQEPGEGAMVNLPETLLPELSLSFSIPLTLTLFFVTISAGAILALGAEIYSSRFLNAYIFHLRSSLFENIAGAQWQFLSRKRIANLNHSLTADIDRIQMTVLSLLHLIRTLFMVGVYLFLSLLIASKLTLVAGSIGAILMLALRPLRRRARQFGIQFTEKRQQQYRIISDFLTGMKTIRAFRAEQTVAKHLTRSLDQLRRGSNAYLQLSGVAATLVQIVSAFGLI